MGKFSKMLYMIDLLNTGNKYSIKDLANKIGVSERMVRYYKEELENNGIFIESFKGPNGGYFLLDKIKNYVSINKYDIQLLEYLLKDLEKNNSEFLKKYKELISKVKMMNSIAEEKSKFISNLEFNDDDNIVKIISDIMKKNESIDILYLNMDGTVNNRKIHPLQMFKYKNIDYVTAYCELRKDIRHFELDRIKKIN